MMYNFTNKFLQTGTSFGLLLYNYAAIYSNLFNSILQRLVTVEHFLFGNTKDIIKGKKVTKTGKIAADSDGRII